MYVPFPVARNSRRPSPDLTELCTVVAALSSLLVPGATAQRSATRILCTAPMASWRRNVGLLHPFAPPPCFRLRRRCRVSIVFVHAFAFAACWGCAVTALGPLPCPSRICRFIKGPTRAIRMPRRRRRVQRAPEGPKCTDGTGAVQPIKDIHPLQSPRRGAVRRRTSVLQDSGITTVYLLCYRHKQQWDITASLRSRSPLWGRRRTGSECG